MKSLVIYATRSGTTKLIAETIAQVLRQRGTVAVLDTSNAGAKLPECDLVVIGGPTERHTLTEPMSRFLDGIAKPPRGRCFATFDTRLRWPRFLSGSAAYEIAARLYAMGTTLVVPPESFFVKGQAGPLAYAPERGEIERARVWAAEVAEAVNASTAAAAGAMSA